MDKVIEELNRKLSINFVKKGEGKYTYSLSNINRIEIDLNTGIVNSGNWYGGYNRNSPWNEQPRREQNLEGLVHNLISINDANKENWKPPF